MSGESPVGPTTASPVPLRIRDALRAPGGEPLLDAGGGGLRNASGEAFPLVDGILWLLPAVERGADLGDGGFYDRHPFGEASGVDGAAVEAGVEPELREVLRALPPDACIADIGCGAGRVSVWLALHGYRHVVSLDASLPSLRQVRAHGSTVCIWGNALHLPLASGRFDLVISTGVAHHTVDPRRAIRESIRIMAPGGRLYLRVYNRHSPYRWLYRSYGAALRRLDASRCTRALVEPLGFRPYRWLRRVLFSRPEAGEAVLRGKFGNLLLKPTVHFLTRREIEACLVEHGLEIESAARRGFVQRMHCHVARRPA